MFERITLHFPNTARIRHVMFMVVNNSDSLHDPLKKEVPLRASSLELLLRGTNSQENATYSEN